MHKDTLIFPPERESLRNRVFKVNSERTRHELMLEVFRYQFKYNEVYRNWSLAFNRNPENVQQVTDIPFLPLSFFRHHAIRSGFTHDTLVFRSSGTTAALTSVCHVADPNLYEESFVNGFIRRYGQPSNYVFIGLLPSYLERSDSSLIYMVKHLMDSGKPGGAFYLHNYEALRDDLTVLRESNAKVWLIGVSFALLDFAAFSPPCWENLSVLETGGMKGRRREMIREELHAEIRKHWNVPEIHSEYGMTELFSQAWTRVDGRFECPPWMQVQIREADDPLALAPFGKTGGIDVVDLANLDTCAFISTADLGRMSADGSFEVLGRFDHAEIRGCNLMIG